MGVFLPSSLPARAEGCWGPRSPRGPVPKVWGRRLPRVQEEGQPQAVELVGDLRVEEGQEAADFIQAVHLEGQEGLGGAASSAPSPAPRGAKDGLPGREGTPEVGGHPYSLGACGGSTPAPPVPPSCFPAREVPLQGHCCNACSPGFPPTPDLHPPDSHRSLEPPASPSHLRAERCLLVEVAVHELAVLPRRDLAAGHGAGSGLARGRARSPHPPGHPAATTSHPQGPTASLSLPGTARGARRCLEPVPASVPAAHLPLVPMQQGRPLIWQSMCAQPVWLVLVS